jgi:hypothetical protein
MSGQFGAIVIGIILTIIAGVADSQGFIHASEVWSGDSVQWPEVARSALGFSIGVALYWLALRYLTRAGIVAPEVQTAMWFGVAVIGVAVVSRRFLHWNRWDQLIGLAVLLGIGWLSLRTEG